MSRMVPYRSPFFTTKRSRPVHNGISKGTIERLSKPKEKDPRWLPDKPSVYWLDYLIDPTPHKITDVDQLQGYYDKYENKYPRLHTLATPRKYYGMMFRDPDIDQKISPISGVPRSALSYKPTPRIEELATPKPEPTYENTLPWMKPPEKKRISVEEKSSKTVLKRSFLTGRTFPQPSRPEVGSFRSNDSLAKGDFKSRSKHGMQTSSRARNTSVDKHLPKTTRSLSRTNRPEGRGGGGGGDEGIKRTQSLTKRSASVDRK